MSIAKAIIEDMKNRPDDFTYNGCVMRDKMSEIEVWVVNGFFFYRVHRPFECNFSLYDKFLFGIAMNKHRKEAALKILRGEK